MSKEELKPCPFCASENIETDYDDKRLACDTAECIKCGALVPLSEWNTRAPQSEWVSVNDRMPPIEEKGENSDPDMVYTHTSDVIALLSSGDTVRTYHDGDVWCYHDLSGCPQYDVTHWMPMPSLPKGIM